MRSRRLPFMCAGVAVVMVVSYAATITSSVAAVPAPTATTGTTAADVSAARQPIAPGTPSAPSASVPVDPATTLLDMNFGTPTGGLVAGDGTYQASDATAPLGTTTTASPAASRGSGVMPLAVTTGATTFPAPGVFVVPSQATTSPSARRSASIALDTAHSVDVLFGGRNASSTYLNDTWTFDGTNWLNKAPATSPSIRAGASMAFDTATGTTILFGGYDGTTYFNDTWSWNGTTWTQLTPATSPSGRRLASMAYSPSLGEIVLFGGTNGTTADSDTWSWNGTTWTSVAGAGPSARSDAGLAYDATGADLLLYGGETFGAASVLGDTWTFTSTGWAVQSPTHYPGVRAGMGFAYDSVLGRVALGGGTDGTSNYQDFWVWNGTDWEQGSQPDFAGPRMDFAMATAATNGQLLAFGGISGTTVLGDTGVIDWGQLGTPKNATFETRPVDDRSTYGVNVYNGNLVVAANDMSVAGVGIGLSLQRRYNNIGGYTDWIGGQWSLTNSFDTWWGALPDGSIVINGVRGEADALYFHKSGATFTSPAGANATLATSGSGYTLTFNATSEVLTFNSSGELTTDADRNGHTITYGWTSGSPSSITDTQGRSYTVTLSGGRISKITDPSSRFVQYTITSGALTQVTDGAGDVSNYSYTGGNLTGIEDPNGKTTVPGYTAPYDRVTSIVDPQTTPNTTSFGYAAPGSGLGAWGKFTSTDQNSNATVYQAQYGGQVVNVLDALSHTRKATFNANSDVLTAVDAIGSGNTTTYGYDALNNPTSAAIPTGASTTAQYANGGGCTSSDSIHPYLVKCESDAQGNQNTFTYDTPGNTLTDTNVTTGAVLTYTYNPAITTCGGKVGQLCSSEDGNSHTTSYSYDANGNLTTITPPTPLGATTQTFDTLGRVATLTDGKSQKTTYSYDGDDRITQVLTNGAATCTYTAGTCVGYGFDDNGNQTSMHDKTGLTQYGFDVMNRQTTKTLPSTATLTLGYDHVGNVTSYVDGGGTVTYGYNAANQLTSLAEPGGSCTGTISLCTTFGVNNNGQRTSTTYPGSTVMTSTLDNSGRPTEVKAVNGPTTLADHTYTYVKSAADTEVAQTMAATTSTANTIAIDTQTSANDSTGGGTVTTPTFSTTGTADVLIALTGSDGPGTGQTVTVAGAGLTWSLVGRSNTQGGDSEIWTATATAALSGVTVHATQGTTGYHQTLTVVALSNAAAVGAHVTGAGATGAPSVSLTTTAPGSLVFGAGNDFTNATARTLPAGQTLVHEFTDTATGDDYWAQRTTSPVTNNGTLTTINATAPTGDQWNLVAAEVTPTMSSSTLTTTYGYDAKNELSSAVEKNSGGTTTASWLYCYDNAGNRTSYSTVAAATCPGATTTYTYNAANELTAVNGTSTGWSYDLDGNETAGASTTARSAETYSASNQLTSVTTGGVATAMTYAGLANDERVTSGASTTFQTGQEGLANQTVSSTTTSWTRDPSGTLISERSGGSHYYYLFDGLGSVVALVSSTGTPLNTYNYDPYGVTRASTGTTINPFTYTSSYKDATGIYHNGARYYDTNLGRFTQQDPSGIEANLYAYASDSPANFVDPAGTSVLSVLNGFATGCFKAAGTTAAFATGAAIITGGTGVELSATALAASCLVGGVGGAIGGFVDTAATVTGTGADILNAGEDIINAFL